MPNCEGRSSIWPRLHFLSRGMWIALWASRRVGLADRLRRKGDHARGLAEALRGIELLRDPSVLRFAPGPFVEIVEAAKLVHELAMRVGRPEQALRPLEEALELLDEDPRRRDAGWFEPSDRLEDEDYDELKTRLLIARAAIEQRLPG